MEQGTYLLGDLPGELDVDVGVVRAVRRRQAGALAVGEVLDPGAQDGADAVQGVALAAVVDEGVGPDAAADVVGGRRRRSRWRA
ncbi:hypothetical protein ACK2IS_01390 [Arsenicicoccus dermatophilus]